MITENRGMRLILTQDCNYHCVFCHKEGLIESEKDRLNAQDYKFLFSVAKEYFQIKEVTLTGGEPLVRNDIKEIIEGIHSEGGRIVLTTNGYLLPKIKKVVRCINRINVSIHSLDLRKYESLVGRSNTFKQVKNNLIQFKEDFPSVEIRLNSTLVKGQNTSKDQILDYLNFARSLNASIKYVELFPRTLTGFFALKEMEMILYGLGFKLILKEDRKKDFLKNGLNIRLSQIFCSYVEGKDHPCNECKEYNDLFVTPLGDIKPCRSHRRKINLLEEIKNREKEKVIGKISLAFDVLGEDCIFDEVRKCLN
jgi:GTP 3',8-cyclase